MSDANTESLSTMSLGSAVRLDIIEGMVSMFDVNANPLKILGAVNLSAS